MNEKIPKEILLKVLLEHPDFVSFHKVGEDDWRDSSEKNPSFSLSSKGSYDFKSGNSVNIYELAKEKGILDGAKKRSGFFSRNQSNPNESGDKSFLAAKIWSEATTFSGDADYIRDYLTEDRNIPSDNYQDLINAGLLRWFPKKNNYPPALIYPFHQIEEDCSLRKQIRKIHFTRKEAFNGKRKNALGKDGHLTVLPPLRLSEVASKRVYLAMEGLEDALSVRQYYSDRTIVVAGSKENLKHLDRLLKKGDELLIIADNDGTYYPNSGQEKAAQICQLLQSKGVNAKALMSAKPKLDANAALQNGKLSEWLKTLVEVPKIKEYEFSDFDIESIKGKKVPKLPKSILPGKLENYLELVAKSLDLNYEAAFIEFLVNASIAIGGNKKINIRPNWQEKAILWVASIGKSGSGKTPLHNQCGGFFLQSIQLRWREQYNQELEQFKNQEVNKPPKPIRKRLIANGLTIERLCALHEDNPAGIGITSDEIIGVLNGLNQYKGKGNDKQKLLTLWNGNSYENPTADSDRYIPSVFVPISGGIQEPLVKEIVSEHNIMDGLASRFLFNYLIWNLHPIEIEEQFKIDRLIEDSIGKIVLEEILEKLAHIRNEPSQIAISEHARNLLATLEFKLKKEQRNRNDQTGAAYAKLRTYIYRVALLLHYITESKPDEVELSENTALNTIQVMKYFLANMQQVYSFVELNTKEQKVKKILDKIRELGGKVPIRKIKQLFKGSIKPEEIEEICHSLEKLGELVLTPTGKTIELSLP